MSKTKVTRCSETGCRVLTAAGKCDQHREPAPAPASVWDKITPEQWGASAAKATAAFNQMSQTRAQRAALRSDLADLQYGAQKQARRVEQPIFFEEN